MTIIFAYERQTKNTVRFSEVEDPSNPGASIGVLYIQKHAVAKLRQDGQVPQQITVEIKAS
jgi:hypothetical protein